MKFSEVIARLPQELKAYYEKNTNSCLDALQGGMTCFIENLFFHCKDSSISHCGQRPSQYREATIQFCIRNGIPIKSTVNNDNELSRIILRAVCPRCETALGVPVSCGGNSSASTIQFKCQCGCAVSLEIPVGGITVAFNK